MGAFRLERFVDVDSLRKAIALVYGEVAADGMDPGSEKWNHTDSKKELFGKVRTIWAEVADHNWWDFPFNMDFVHLSFVRYRKLNAAERLSVMEELEL